MTGYCGTCFELGCDCAEVSPFQGKMERITFYRRVAELLDSPELKQKIRTLAYSDHPKPFDKVNSIISVIKEHLHER